MPIIGRLRKPKPKREGCKTPRWTGFIRKNTLWQCRKCGTVYRLDKTEFAYSMHVNWEIYTG